MKKALIYGLSAALLLASLTACNKPQAEQPNQSEPPTQAATSSPASEPATTPEPATTTEPTAQTPAVPEQLSSTTQATNESDTSQPPEVTESQEPAVELFTDCNETVYATGTVNLRESWSAESEKLGSLSTGDAVTRTGVAIAGTEAEGWSRVQLSDGSVAYISNRYLSTTKPTTQSTSNGGGTGTTQTTQPTTQAPQSQDGGNVIDTSGDRDAFINSLNEIRRQNGGSEGADHAITPEEAAGIAGSVHLEN